MRHWSIRIGRLVVWFTLWAADSRWALARKSRIRWQADAGPVQAIIIWLPRSSGRRRAA